ncbi:hypothetical protein AGDE_16686 [Angomonas deanei]|nr:hypothetical protein AGDE_16686 [Angomonas deanei]|eukprot:EPY16623.1 hypothetical protein AGDE_16686 [Angomonas deanei]
MPGAAPVPYQVNMNPMANPNNVAYGNNMNVPVGGHSASQAEKPPAARRMTPQQFRTYRAIPYKERMKIQPDPDGPILTEPYPFDDMSEYVFGMTLESVARVVRSPDEAQLEAYDRFLERKKRKSS